MLKNTGRASGTLRCNGTPSHALTLVEVCLVLALLVVIGAVSAPLLGGSFSRAGLRSGGDVLRGALARTRLAAMESGQTYVFRYEPNGSRYQILTLSEVGLPEGNVIAPDTGGERDVSDRLRLSENRLPEGIVFATGNVSASSQLMATLGSTGEGPWSAPILFQPDGTTSDASILLTNGQQQTIRVTLRGLTGISNISDVGNEAVPL